MKKFFAMLAVGCAAALIAGCTDVKEKKTVDPNRTVAEISEEVKTLDADALRDMIAAYDDAITVCAKKIDAMQKEINKVKVIDINGAEANAYRAEQEAARVTMNKLSAARAIYKAALAAIETKTDDAAKAIADQLQ
ncbi:MAG: hypothetical protein PHI85_05335 [Victivallaceae bacterium]|nr:hypothetical protein [Victivallaceae bacterium]